MEPSYLKEKQILRNTSPFLIDWSDSMILPLGFPVLSWGTSSAEQGSLPRLPNNAARLPGISITFRFRVRSIFCIIAHGNGVHYDSVMQNVSDVWDKAQDSKMISKFLLAVGSHTIPES